MAHMHDTECSQERFLMSVAWCTEAQEWVVTSWWEHDQLSLFETAMPGPAEQAQSQTWAGVAMVLRSMVLAQDRKVKGLRHMMARRRARG